MNSHEGECPEKDRPRLNPFMRFLFGMMMFGVTGSLIAAVGYGGYGLYWQSCTAVTDGVVLTAIPYTKTDGKGVSTRHTEGRLRYFDEAERQKLTEELMEEREQLTAVPTEEEAAALVEARLKRYFIDFDVEGTVEESWVYPVHYDPKNPGHAYAEGLKVMMKPLVLGFLLFSALFYSGFAYMVYKNGMRMAREGRRLPRNVRGR